jgi:hypothetical protein
MYVQFKDPSPDAHLIVGTKNTLAVAVTANTGDSLGWSVIPTTALSGRTSGIAKVVDGKATFDFRISKRPGTDSLYMVLVSVWDPAVVDAPHYTALYRCARPRMEYSLSQTYAETDGHNAAPRDPNSLDPDQALLLVLWLSDADEGTPLAGSKVTWKGQPTNPTTVLTWDGQAAKLDPDDPTGLTYLTTTDSNGRAALQFGNTAPSIISMYCIWGGVYTRPFNLAFTAFGTPWLTPRTLPPVVPDLVNLDDYDDTGVPIVINSDSNFQWMGNGSIIEVAFWLNGFMTYPARVTVGKAVKIPKPFFMAQAVGNPATNSIGYTVNDPNSDNGYDSAVQSFQVTGTVPQGGVQPPSDSLKDLVPYLVGNPQTVDSRVIAGGLQVWVPKSYSAFRQGDVVVMRLFLTGIFPGTTVPKSNTLASPDFPIPADQLFSSFSFVFSAAQLYGYAGAARLTAQYEVRRAGVSLYSAVLSLPLATDPAP